MTRSPASVTDLPHYDKRLDSQPHEFGRLRCTEEAALRSGFLQELVLLRKEVIQPQVPLRLPCYDFTPITSHTLGACPPCRLAPATSGTTGFRGVTGGVYKARERIHPGVLIRDY